jgi:hypothetical protein
MKGAESLVRTLMTNGVDVCFAKPDSFFAPDVGHSSTPRAPDLIDLVP